MLFLLTCFITVNIHTISIGQGITYASPNDLSRVAIKVKPLCGVTRSLHDRACDGSCAHFLGNIPNVPKRTQSGGKEEGKRGAVAQRQNFGQFLIC